MTFNQVCDMHYGTMKREYEGEYTYEDYVEEIKDLFVEENCVKCDTCPLAKDCEMKENYEKNEIDDGELEQECKSYLWEVTKFDDEGMWSNWYRERGYK